MRAKLTIIILFSLGLFFLTALSVLAQDIDGPLSIPGRIQGTGTLFEITDSEYLNISLQSINEITITLESVPKTISLIIEASSVYSSTTLTFSNLEPNTTYYKFEDSYKNKVEFTTSESGQYTFTQDIAQPHHIWFQPQDNGTVFLPEDCATYGVWDELISTCTLTQDLTESVEITIDNITLDCSGYSIIGADTGYGIYLNSRLNIQIKNCSIGNFSRGINLLRASNNTLTNNAISNNEYGISLGVSSNNIIADNTISLNSEGIFLNTAHANTISNNKILDNSGFGLSLSWFSNSNTITNNHAFNNGYYGIYLERSENNALTNNIVSDNSRGIYLMLSTDNILTGNAMLNNQHNFSLFGLSDEHFNNNIDISNTVNAKSVYYVLNASDQVYDSPANAGVFYCINCNRVKLKNLVLEKNKYGIFFWKTQNSTIENVTVSNNETGILLRFSDNNILASNVVSNNTYGIGLGDLFYWGNSHNNTLINNTITSNSYGIILNYSNNNKVYHNNFIYNTHGVYIYSSLGNLFDKGYPSGGNYWSSYRGIDQHSGPAQDQPGADGIGDTPYTFRGGQDRYPFMKESGWEVPPVPTYSVAVILAEPSDKSFETGHNKAYFEGIKDQVRDYYCENAFGKWDENTKICDGGVFNLEIKIFDNDRANYKLSQTQIYYGENFPQAQEISLGLDGNGREIKIEKVEDGTASFIWEAINEADNEINYNDYQGVIVIYKGYSDQQKPKCEDCLYTHHWSPKESLGFSTALINSPTESIDNWIAVSENETKYAWAHELGHALGNILTGAPLEDLYPPKASRSYGGNVVDYFDIMGRRTPLWGLIKDTVSYFSSFTKIKLNWLKEKVVGYGNYPIESLETMKHGDEVVRYNALPNSYYLLEARTNDSQYSIWDRDVPENDPLVIYKVSPKEVPVNGRTVIMDFVNVKAIGAYFLNPFPLLDPLDIPFKDPVNKVLIEIDNRIAEPNSFKINAKISEYSLLKYIGIILRPKLDLLGKMWEFAPTPREMVRGGEKDYLHIFGHKTKIYEFTQYPYLSSIQQLLWYLLILFILILFPIWLCIRRRILRKIILWIIIFLVIIFILLRFFVSFVAASNLDDPVSSRNVLYESFPADLDLHAYDNQGNHAGINYETGEYENQITGAETSGDLVYDDEWIFVPEGTNIRYVVSSKDIYNMLEAEPELKELIDGIETYEVQAIHYDETSQRYESNVISQEIIPGAEQNYSITGTHEQTQIERTITISDIIKDVETAYDLGWITKPFVKTILIAKLKAAQKLEEQKEKQLKHFDELIEKAKNPKVKQALEKAKEKYEEATNKAITKILKSFIKEVENYTRKEWITTQASELLINDANYIIEHL